MWLNAPRGRTTTPRGDAVVLRHHVALYAHFGHPGPTGDAGAYLRPDLPRHPGERRDLDPAHRAVDVCLVDGTPVTPQPGGFYGGWITHKVSGPFKGSPGTMGW